MTDGLNLTLIEIVREGEPSTLQLNTLTSSITDQRQEAYKARCDDKYRGQTILHVAICKENLSLVRKILDLPTEKKDNEHLKAVLGCEATGTKFKKSLMLGGLPLIVAALTLNRNVFNIVHNAGMDYFEKNFSEWFMRKNSNQDNIFHCLIIYSHLYPGKSKNAVVMFHYVMRTAEMYLNEEEIHQMLKQRNKKGKNPLLLAAYLGQVAIFKLILGLKLYCISDAKDVEFDIKEYDISEIDTATENDLEKQAPLLCILHDLEPPVASLLASSGPIGRVITKKWSKYRLFFYIWLIIHFTFVGILTWYAVERSARDMTLQASSNFSCPRPISERGFTSSYHFFGLVIAILYMTMEVSMIVKSLPRLCRRFTEVSETYMAVSSFTKCLLRSVLHPYGNGLFKISFLLISVFLITDLALVYSVDCYDNYMLLCAVVLGWFLFLFFIRCWQRFSFFTLFIQQVALNEMLSFFVILTIQVAAFGTALYMTIQGSPIAEDEEYSTYWRTLFSLARLAVGNGELNNLYSTKYPALTISIFVAFVIMTILLMMNALIAILGQTAQELITQTGDQKPHYRHFLLQRLSIILFIESFIPSRFHRSVGKIKSNRRTIKLKSLREPGSTDNDYEAELEEFRSVEDDNEINSSLQFSKHTKCHLDIYSMQPMTKTSLTPVDVFEKN